MFISFYQKSLYLTTCFDKVKLSFINTIGASSFQSQVEKLAVTQNETEEIEVIPCNTAGMNPSSNPEITSHMQILNSIINWQTIGNLEETPLVSLQPFVVITDQVSKGTKNISPVNIDTCNTLPGCDSLNIALDV